MQRRRWMLFVICAPLYLFALMVIGTFLFVLLISEHPAEAVRDFSGVFEEPGWWSGMGIAASVVAGSQLIFLIPVFQFQRARAERGRSIVVSSLLLAILAAALTTGLVTGIAELFGPWGKHVSRESMFTPEHVDIGEQTWFGWLFCSTLIASWILWSLVIVRFARRGTQPERKLGKLVGLMLGGTVIEALVILPIDVMVRRRTDCYCNTGTFITLLFSLVAAIWLTGPGVFIALTSRRRRAWYELHCINCGYVKGPSPGLKCPECGFEWGKRSAASGGD